MVIAKMIRLLFDTNIFEMIDSSPVLQKRINSLIESNKIVILASDSVLGKLKKSESAKSINSFPVKSFQGLDVSEYRPKLSELSELVQGRSNESVADFGIYESVINSDFDILATGHKSYLSSLEHKPVMFRAFGFEELKYFLYEGVS